MFWDILSLEPTIEIKISLKMFDIMLSDSWYSAFKMPQKTPKNMAEK